MEMKSLNLFLQGFVVILGISWTFYEAYRRKGSKAHSERLTHLFGKLKDQWFQCSIPGFQVTMYIYLHGGRYVVFGTSLEGKGNLLRKHPTVCIPWLNSGSPRGWNEW